MKIAGNISILRCTLATESFIRIELTDDLSRVCFASFSMSLEDFAKAITGQGWIDGEIDVRNLAAVGKTSENKEEVVPYKNEFLSEEQTQKAVDKALKPFEVDGWRARRDDMTNYYRRAGKGQRVVFFRHTGKSVVEREREEA